MGQHDRNARQPSPAGLTDKQREVLDLLLEHKTSKQIARQLRISPHTVDQRIQFAKDKLGARTRSEAAVAYRRLLETWEGMTYEDLGIAPDATSPDDDLGGRVPVEAPEPPKWIGSGTPGSAKVDYRVAQGMLDGRYGTLVRLSAIVVIAVLIVLLVLGALATFAQLSLLLSR